MGWKSKRHRLQVGISKPRGFYSWCLWQLLNFGGSKTTEKYIPETECIPLQTHSFSKISTWLLLLLANKSNPFPAKPSPLPESKILFLNKAFISMPFYKSQTSSNYHSWLLQTCSRSLHRGFQTALWWLLAMVLPSSAKWPFLLIASVESEHNQSFWTSAHKYSSEASISTYYKIAIPVWQSYLIFKHI